MKTYTDEELNIAVCETLGWKHCDKCNPWCGWWMPPGTDCWRNSTKLPNHITGIEALGRMHEVVARLFARDKNRYAKMLRSVFCSKGIDMDETVTITRALMEATARQRAIAYLRVVRPEMWKD